MAHYSLLDTLLGTTMCNFKHVKLKHFYLHIHLRGS